MATINFELRKTSSQRKNKTGMSMLMIRYSHQSKVTYFFTKKNIKDDHWDKTKKQVKRTMDDHQDFNIYISNFKRKIEDIVNYGITHNIEPTTDYVRNEFTDTRKSRPVKNEMSFDEFVKHHLNNVSKKVTKGTLVSYQNAVNNLNAFEDYTNTKLTWETIDMDFYYSFMDFYFDVKKCSSNGLGKVFKVLKTLLNAATEQGYNSNLTYKNRAFKITKEPVDNIYLSEKELSILMDLDLSENQKLNRVRDLFIIGCYTGLRFSDFSTITSNNIVGDTIRVRTTKTNTQVIIPLLDEIKVVLAKYDGCFPKAYSNQKMNQYLKELGKEANFNETVVKVNKKGSTRIQSNFYKWELMKTHTARRSYATNMFLRGASAINIMQITGHSTQESFMRYIKISKEENANMMLEQFKKSV